MPAAPISPYITQKNAIASMGPFQRSCEKQNACSSFDKSFDSKLIIWPLQPSPAEAVESRNALRYNNPPHATRASHAALKMYKIVGWYDTVKKADDRTIPAAYQLALDKVIAFDSVMVKQETKPPKHMGISTLLDNQDKMRNKGKNWLKSNELG